MGKQNETSGIGRAESNSTPSPASVTKQLEFLFGFLKNSLFGGELPKPEIRVITKDDPFTDSIAHTLELGGNFHGTGKHF